MNNAPIRSNNESIQQKSASARGKVSRRGFLGGTAIGLAVASFPIASRAASPSEVVRVALLGAGSKGSQLASFFNKADGAKIVMVADPDITRAKKTADLYNAVGVKDLRMAIDSSDVDAVVIATCDHWHCLAAVWALEAGKDVYVEKPLGHNQWEGRQVVNGAKKYNRIVQLGTQQRSDPIQAEARKFLHEERGLGEIKYVQANRLGVRAPIGKRSTPLPFPKDVDRNLWFGPAEVKPMFRDQLHYDWHWDWNTGTGEMGNWGVHILDDVRNVAYQDQQSLPSKFTVGGGRVGWDDAGDTPNLHFAALETDSFPTMIALSNLATMPNGKENWRAVTGENWPADPPGSGYVIVCEGGFYLGQRSNGKAVDLDGKTIREFRSGTDIIEAHVVNFIDAVQSRDASMLNAPIENGHYSTGWCNLANVAFRAGGSFSEEQLVDGIDFEAWPKLIQTMTNQLAQYGEKVGSLRSCPTLAYDAKTECFVGDHAESANELGMHGYRDGFELRAVS